MSLHDLAMYIIDRSNDAMHEANTAHTLKVPQSQSVTPDITDAAVAAVASSVPSPSLHIFPLHSMCVAPVSTTTLSQSKSEPCHNAAKAPQHSLLYSSD